MRTWWKAWRLLLLAFACAALAADCEGNVVVDPTFRDWCGASLCSWQTDAGTIARVPTWNANDFGVALLDKGTQISQETAENEATCLLFTSVADIEPSAQVTLSIDFDRDGKVETALPLAATQWHRVQLEITAPIPYNGIRFAIRKGGTGAAILAEMRIQSINGCADPRPVRHDLLLGQSCASDDECQDGVCGEVAGSGRCGFCSNEHPCAKGVCTFSVLAVPQCSPGQHLGETDEVCLLDSDCRSGTCDGSRLVPFSGSDAGICQLHDLAAGPSDAASTCKDLGPFGIGSGRCR